MKRSVAAVTSAVVMVAAVLVLREQTMTRHVPGRPGTITEVVVDASVRGAEAATTAEELTTALVLACRLEVEAEPVTGLDPLAGDRHRYRQVLAPALDEFDERQLHGCLEDARLDHLQLEVVVIEGRRGPSPSGGEGNDVRPAVPTRSGEDRRTRG